MWIRVHISIRFIIGLGIADSNSNTTVLSWKWTQVQLQFVTIKTSFMSLKQAFKASMMKLSQPDNCLWFHQKLTIFVQVHQIKICGTICQIFPPEISKLSCHCRGAGAVLQPPDTFLSELPAASTVGICPLLFLGKIIFESKKSRKTTKRMAKSV